MRLGGSADGMSVRDKRLAALERRGLGVMGRSGPDAVDLTDEDGDFQMLDPAPGPIDLTYSPVRPPPPAAQPSRATKAPARATADEWTCPACTFINSQGSCCGACYADRPGCEGRGPNDAPQAPSVDLEADAAFARSLADLCELCDSAPANPGYSLCQGCYDAHLRGGGDGGASSSGFGGSGLFGGGDGAGQSALCTMCHSSPANLGYQWCTPCYLSQQGRGAGGGGRGGGGVFGGGGGGFLGGVFGGGGFGGGGGGGHAAAPREGASYEELLAWEAAQGSAGPSKGFNRHQLARLPRRAFKGGGDALKGDEASCSICMCEYEEGEELSLMPACAHAFHAECIETWLKDKSTCPVCMRDVKEDLKRA